MFGCVLYPRLDYKQITKCKFKLDCTLVITLLFNYDRNTNIIIVVFDNYKKTKMDVFNITLRSKVTLTFAPHGYNSTPLVTTPALVSTKRAATSYFTPS